MSYEIKPLQMGKVYSIGHDAMDRQHDRLFLMINKLIALQGESLEAQREGLRRIFPKVADFAVRHFRSEERLMDAMGWPGAEAHKRLHAKLLGEVSAMQERILKAKPGSLSEVSLKEAILFLKTWIVEHILVTDKRYGDSIRETRSVPQEMGMEDLGDMPAF